MAKNSVNFTDKSFNSPKGFKTVTLDDVTAVDTGPIYVTNTSGKINPSTADVFITVYVGNQTAPIMLSVPASWKPFNLTEQAPRAAILNSQHFVRSVSSGMITLMSREEALSILATPAAIKETERLSQIRSKVEAAVRNPNADEFKLTLEGQENEESDGKRHNLSAMFFDEGSVQTAFKAWVTKLNSLSVDDAINAARIRGEFSMEELQYFCDNTTHSRLRNGLKKKLQGMATV